MKIRHSLRFYTKLATELVRGHEAIGPAIRNRTEMPVPISQLCRSVGVCDITPMPMQVEGFLVKTPAGLAIRVNADRSLTRQRFTIAHELGHILLSQYDGKPIEVKCRSQHFSSDEESLVDMIAAEILMPSDEISKLVRSHLCGWNIIEHIVWNYRVSYSSAIRRLLDTDGIHGVWITANQTTCESLSAWSTDSVCEIANPNRIWKEFCWDPADGVSGDICIFVRDAFGRTKSERLKGELKYMHRMGNSRTSASTPNNCWILAWAASERPMVQLTFDFAFGL